MYYKSFVEQMLKTMTEDSLIGGTGFIRVFPWIFYEDTDWDVLLAEEAEEAFIAC